VGCIDGIAISGLSGVEKNTKMIGTLFSLFFKLSVFSLLAFGGINALLPVLYDLSVNQEHWINSQTFSDYFAIAQAAPGPNLMTVTLIGWKVGGVLGAVIATLAISWPSAIMIYYLQRSILGMQDKRKQQVIQFAAGAVAVGLILSAAWQISLQINQSAAAYFFTRIHPLYLIGIGAILGTLGFI
jgi:chromate transporter